MTHLIIFTNTPLPKTQGKRPATRAAFPSALIHRLSLASSILSNPSPHPKRHTHHNVRSKKACPERGSARGKYAGFATPSAFPLANFRRETIPGFPHAVPQRHFCIHALKRNAFNH